MNTPAFFCIDNLTIDVTVGKNDVTSIQNKVEIFPNPASEVLYFRNINVNSKRSISIFNMNGQMLSENYINANQKSLDISNLPVGIYSVKIQTESETIYKKFVKH
jgi:hypothetical protein